MTPKEKKAKRKHDEVENTNRQPRVEGHVVGPNIPDQKLRKKSSKHHVDVPQVIPQTSSAKDREDTLKADKTPAVEIDNVKKAKKRKRKDAESDYKSGDKEEELIQLLPAKKRKNRTEFADPREDSALNNQSRKALEYAFMQMNKPSKWKFNKARQNWIIRNLWSSEALPETYLPLTLKYLSKIQGGSRMKLIEEAQTILHPKDTPPNPETSPGKTMKIPQSVETVTSITKPVPGPLISTDPNPGPLLDSEPMSTTNEPSSAVVKVSETHALPKVKKIRAKQLLEALSSHHEDP